MSPSKKRSMEVYNNVMYDMLVKHIQAKDEAIEKLTSYVKELIAELKCVYEKNINTENESNILNLEKYNTKNTIIRWEQSKKNSKNNQRNRATGVVTSNGFLEFKRVIDETVTSRTNYNSLKEWTDTLPKDGKYRVMKR